MPDKEFYDFMVEQVKNFAQATKTGSNVERAESDKIKKLHPVAVNEIKSTRNMRLGIFLVVLGVSILGIAAPTIFIVCAFAYKPQLLNSQVLIAYFTSVCSQSLLLLIILTKALFSPKFYDMILALGK